MSYFPFFVNLVEKEGLVVGGSTVALRKVQKLLPYGPRLTVCAPAICEQIRQIPGLRLLEAPFAEDMLEGKVFVIAATSDRELNAGICRACQERKIPVNVVDDRELCTFLFPALVKRGSLSIGICTGGASPTAAIYWKKQIGAMIPERFGEMLEWLDEVRSLAKASLPSEVDRSRFCAQMFSAGLAQGKPLSSGETQEALEAYQEGAKRS